MILKFLIFSILITLVIRFVVRFILPIFKISQMAHQRIDEVNKRMEQMQRQQSKSSKRKKPDGGEYIDFEEIK